MLTMSHNNNNHDNKRRQSKAMLMMPPKHEMNIHHRNFHRQLQQEDASMSDKKISSGGNGTGSNQQQTEEPNMIALSEDILKKEGGNDKPQTDKTCSSSPPTTATFKRRSSLYVPSVTWSDMTTHGMLGSGAFCDVYKVGIKDSILRLPPSSTQQTLGCSSDSWEEKNNHDEGNQQKQQGYYALKCLSERAMKHEHDYMVAAMDLAFEAKLLSGLDHRNIITLYATNHDADRPSNNTTARAGATLILILELLDSTLHDKLTSWRTAARSSKSITSLLKSSKDGKSEGPKYKVSTSQLIHRLESTAMGIVEGMEYLHQGDIVLRDLKPDNIGYTSDGTVKLFDLGLAQYLVRPSTTSSLSNDGSQNTNDSPRDMAGSLRYMAPENGLKKGCTLSSDVYSFGILLWELCTLKRPYSEIKSIPSFREQVFVRQYRPSLRRSFATPPGSTLGGGRALGKLLQECWHDDPMKRPTFDSIRSERLPAILTSLKVDEQEESIRTPLKRSHSLSSSFNRLMSSSPNRGGSSRGIMLRSTSLNMESFPSERGDDHGGHNSNWNDDSSCPRVDEQEESVRTPPKHRHSLSSSFNRLMSSSSNRGGSFRGIMLRSTSLNMESSPSERGDDHGDHNSNWNDDSSCPRSITHNFAVGHQKLGSFKSSKRSSKKSSKKSTVSPDAEDTATSRPSGTRLSPWLPPRLLGRGRGQSLKAHNPLDRDARHLSTSRLAAPPLFSEPNHRQDDPRRLVPRRSKSDDEVLRQDRNDQRIDENVAEEDDDKDGSGLDVSRHTFLKLLRSTSVRE